MNNNNKLFKFSSEGKNYVFNGEDFAISLQQKNTETKPVGKSPSIKSQPFLRTLALTITNNCNLGCQYCYANKGDWDKPGEIMSQKTAFRSVEILLESVLKKTTVN